jgi:hypothetical protein
MRKTLGSGYDSFPVRGRALPDGEFVDLYADGDRWTTDRCATPNSSPRAGCYRVWSTPTRIPAPSFPETRSRKRCSATILAGTSTVARR